MTIPHDPEYAGGLPATTSVVGGAGWHLAVYESAGSTNDLARRLPPWHAVRADQQTSGRGRFGRAFVSDPGGLWLSAVLPGEGGAVRWTGFSLTVGCHLLRMLARLGLPAARLRWPNDILVGMRKLSGILIEQGARDSLIVGIGMNVRNCPWKEDSSLAPCTTRLADLLPGLDDLDSLTIHILDALADAHAAMESHGLTAAIDELNLHWNSSPAVEITRLEGPAVRGLFAGLDRQGNLRIRGADGQEQIVPHHHVGRLVELTAAES
ncbi:MAG TPA: biotin--[acetyl-CoA-carboxylase] ligase [Terrimicrobiaceae bacterium]|nr:biotin--[acetyl-CoA-carboxylase] ligase [Terrimicrobiaceae bacterium]